jgi:hypothetical protein
MIPDGSLKVVVAWSLRRNLCDIVGERLMQVASQDDLRALGDDTVAVWTARTVSDLRDLLREVLGEDEGLLVVEFETWSGFGQALDKRWLLERGH